MNPEEIKNIRFIDSHYNHLFTVPDGANIIITHEDGEKLIRPCKYLDDYHTRIGTSIYHICEFAERMEQAKASYTPEQPMKLPDLCYTNLPTSGELIIIKRDQQGYSPCGFASGSAAQDKATADRLNSRAGITRQQVAAMIGGSMFGWDTPAAKVESYDLYGKPVKPTKTRKHQISSPDR